MTFSYYPGCTLKTKAVELDRFARKSAEVLGIQMEELENWQCCGGVYPLAKNETATKLSSVRALAAARDKGQELLTLCSACHHVLKRVNDDMKNDENVRTKANNYLQLDTPYEGETNVIHYLEMLRDRVGFDVLKKMVKNPLKDMKIGAFYGCLLLRPSNAMQFDDPENPKIMEDFIRAIGATPVIFPYRNECCGGYVAMENNEYATKKCNTICKSASGMGADALITACPLCMYNLDANTTQNKLPVYYFTQLLARALGVEEDEA